MMHDLFAVEPPHQAHSPTSAASAAETKPRFGKNMLKVLAALSERDGLTDEEGCEASNMTGNSYRPARVACENLGLIVKTDATRKTKSGRNAAIYMLTMLGKMECSR